MSDGKGDEVIVYALSPVDFILLALCSFFLFYVLPRKFLKSFDREARR
jgi:hypothetical protein